MSPTKKWLHLISFILVSLGAVNLGIFGIVPADETTGQGFDLIQQIFGFNPDVLNIMYILIGAAGVYLIITHVRDCKVCDAKKQVRA